jgi:hypothetical protein
MDSIAHQRNLFVIFFINISHFPFPCVEYDSDTEEGAWFEKAK